MEVFATALFSFHAFKILIYKITRSVFLGWRSGQGGVFSVGGISPDGKSRHEVFFFGIILTRPRFFLVASWTTSVFLTWRSGQPRVFLCGGLDDLGFFERRVGRSRVFSCGGLDNLGFF